MTKVVFVSGNFNVLHPGHLRLLRFARDLGDRLIVGVQSDRIAGDAAHIPESLRLESLSTNSYVDECFLVDEPVENVVGRLRPDVVVKGNEHREYPNPEAEVLSSYGGQLVFSSGEATFSSLDLIRRDLEDAGRVVRSLPADYLDRHGIDVAGVRELVDGFGSLSVCVVGDLIVDEYVTCEPLGMSQEDPTIVVTPVDTTTYVGGAGIVAAHAAGLGAGVTCLTVAGEDEAGAFAESQLASLGVDAAFFVDGVRSTPLKQRYRAAGKTLLRVSRLHQAPIEAFVREGIVARFEEIVESCDLLVFSDFNYGCLPQDLVDDLADRARERGVPMVADSQSSSQIGDVARFRGMDLLTPTEHEARVSLRNQQDGLVVLAEKLRITSGARTIIMKMGAEGALLHREDVGADIHTDRIPALNPTPRDVAGAGDSLMISSAMATARGANPWEAGLLGSVAAAIQVDRMGNVPLSSSDLHRELA